MLAWFEVLACVSRSAMLLDGVRAALDGRAHDPNVLALATALVSASLVRGARLAWADDVGDVTSGDDVAPAVLHPTAVERDRVLARFLAGDVLPAIDDRRLRRQVKIAAALLAPARRRDGRRCVAGTGRLHCRSARKSLEADAPPPGERDARRPARPTAVARPLRPVTAL